MFYKLKKIYRNLKNWLPVIIKDEQWDYGYLYDILYRKLELKEKFFRSNNTNIEDWEIVADEIKDVREALERLMKDDYIPYEVFRKDVKASILKEEEMKQNDLEAVFGGMKNNIRKWWD